MPLVVPNAALARCIWNLGGVPTAVNVYGVLNPGGTAITQTLTNTIGAAIKAQFATSGLNARLNNQVTLANVGLRSLAAPNLPEYLDAGAAVPGTNAGELLPLQVCLVVTLRTALAGRSFRGRSYVWGFTEADNTVAGAASATAQTAAKAWLDGINSALGGSGMSLAVVSRTRSVVNQVTATQVRDGVWDTIRKRAVPGI